MGKGLTSKQIWDKFYELKDESMDELTQLAIKYGTDKCRFIKLTKGKYAIVDINDAIEARIQAERIYWT